MILTIRSHKPAEIQEFVKRNDPTCLQPTAGASLKAYQAAHGGSGSTFKDLESSWLLSLGYSTYDAFMAGISYLSGTIRESVRKFLANYTFSGGTSSYYLLEDGTSKYLLEDGSGFYILE